MQKTRGSSDSEHSAIIGLDFSRLECVPEGSGSRTVGGNLNPMLEMDSAHSETYLGREPMFQANFWMPWKHFETR